MIVDFEDGSGGVSGFKLYFLTGWSNSETFGRGGGREKERKGKKKNGGGEETGSFIHD